MSDFTNLLEKGETAHIANELREIGCESSEGFSLSNVVFVVQIYGAGAHAPLNLSREAELSHVQSYAKHYGRTITAEEFDWAIAYRFADGCEFEWACD